MHRILIGIALFILPLFSKEFILQLSKSDPYRFIGVYLAKHQGLFNYEGLNVHIQPYDPQASFTPLERLKRRQVDCVIGEEEMLLGYLRGAPITLIGSYFQQSTQALFRTQKSNHRLLSGLTRNPILAPNARLSPLIELMFYQEEILPSSLLLSPLKTLPVRPSHSNTVFMSDRLEVLNAPSAFTYQNLTPNHYGLDFYGDSLFTHQALVKHYPEELLALHRAILKGWQLFLDNPQNTLKRLVAKDPETFKNLINPHETITLLKTLLSPGLIPLGTTTQGRWHYMAERFDEHLNMGSFKNDPHTLDRFFYENLLNPKSTFTLYHGLIGLMVLILLLGGLLWYKRQKIALQSASSNQTEPSSAASPLLQQKKSLIDPLTQLYNQTFFNLYFSEHLQEKRPQSLTLALLEIDGYDHFLKHSGHQEAERALEGVAKALHPYLEENRIYGFYRLKGAFALVFEEVAFNEVFTTLSSIKEVIRNRQFPHSHYHKEGVITASVGMYHHTHPFTQTPYTIITHTQSLLTKAQEQGYNRIVVDQS